MLSYEIYKMRTLSSVGYAYGLIAKENQNDVWVPIAIVAGFSTNLEAVRDLAEKCTVLQLSPIHMLDVISDYITGESMNNA